MFYGPVRTRRVLVATTLLLVGVLAAASRRPPAALVRAITAESAASPYVAEFRRAEKSYPGGDAPRAPNGRASVEIAQEPGIPVLNDSCHSVWLVPTAGARLRIISLLEGDPGSGTSFGMSWSADSKAVFLYGRHSGFNCPWHIYSRDLRVIYTLEDGVAWELPPREVQ